MKINHFVWIIINKHIGNSNVNASRSNQQAKASYETSTSEDTIRSLWPSTFSATVVVFNPFHHFLVTEVLEAQEMLCTVTVWAQHSLFRSRPRVCRRHPQWKLAHLKTVYTKNHNEHTAFLYLGFNIWYDMILLSYVSASVAFKRKEWRIEMSHL